ncbi:UPF0149 family protein [Bradyrhizobium sp. S3.12.5]|uniref:UPF0149 family protein n=1 Tax=Bradyrhizobium sp. S3.12.5 TaxID=3156386 RepID=UPI00339912BF
MASAAMLLEELTQWLQARLDRHPAATSLFMLDGYVAAIVAGPVSMSPLDWICPLLAIDADAFNHGGTPEFAAISAVALRHNEISQTLSTTPRQFAPMHRREVNGDIDARLWCQGFYAAMRLRLSAWAPLLDGNGNHGLLLPILLHCRDDQGRPLLGPPRRSRETEDFLRNVYADIPAASRPCANTGCRSATHAPADHRGRGSSYPLLSTDYSSTCHHARDCFAALFSIFIPSEGWRFAVEGIRTAALCGCLRSDLWSVSRGRTN